MCIYVHMFHMCIYVICCFLAEVNQSDSFGPVKVEHERWERCCWEGRLFEPVLEHAGWCSRAGVLRLLQQAILPRAPARAPEVTPLSEVWWIMGMVGGRYLGEGRKAETRSDPENAG